MKNKILSITREVIPYVKELRPYAKSITSCILMQQLDYWFSKYPEGFYKFISPCDSMMYKAGDSWEEELGLTSDEFRYAFDNIGVRYSSRKDLEDQTDPFQGKYYYSFFDRAKGVTFYYRNHETVDCLLSELCTTEQEIVSNYKASGKSQVVSGNGQMASGKSQVYHYTEINAENNSDISAPDFSSVNEESKGTFDQEISNAGIVSYSPTKKSLIKYLASVSVNWSDTRITNELRKFKKASYDTRKTMLFNLYDKGATFAKVNDSTSDTFVYKSNDEQQVEKAQKATNIDTFKGIELSFIPEALREYCVLAVFKKFYKICKKVHKNWEPLETDFVNYQKAIISLGYEIFNRAARNAFWITEHEDQFFQTLDPSKFLGSVKIIKSAAFNEILNARKFPTLQEENRQRSLDKLQKQLRHNI